MYYSARDVVEENRGKNVEENSCDARKTRSVIISAASLYYHFKYLRKVKKKPQHY